MICIITDSTAQIPPDTFWGTFEKHLAAGDQVLGIFLSSDLSGTYQSACIARDLAYFEQI